MMKKEMERELVMDPIIATITAAITTSIKSTLGVSTVVNEDEVVVGADVDADIFLVSCLFTCYCAIACRLLDCEFTSKR